mgnify:CR=1 FL=1
MSYRMDRNFLKLLLFFLIVSGNVFSQTLNEASKFAKTITVKDLRKHLEIIASDEYEGRETGEKGQKMAAEYISKHFKELGLAGPTSASNPYYQPFKLYKNYWDEVELGFGDEELTYLEEFFLYGNFSIEEEGLPFVFAGYGIDEEKYSDYEGLDVEDKAVAVWMGQPVDNETGNYLLSGTDKPSQAISSTYKIKAAAEKGAKAIFLIYESDDEFNNRLEVYKPYLQKPSLSTTDGSKEQGKIGVFFMGPSSLSKVLGLSEKKYQKLEKKYSKKKAAAVKSQPSLQLTATKSSEEVMTENVLGYMEGTDLKDELLVVTAHYDHIGKSGDEINNGADDDGSGTVTVLEIAEAFSMAKADSVFPRRSILFMTVTGEEKGLLGSAYYSDNPVFPLGNTIANLNIDMVGRVDDKHADNPDYIYVIGSDMLSSELHDMHEEVARKYAPDVELDYTYNAKDDPNRFYYRSDHYNFAKHGIPVIFYFNGTHEDYHQPTDTVEKINFEKMSKIGRLIFHTAWELANRDTRPVVDQSESD